MTPRRWAAGGVAVALLAALGLASAPASTPAYRDDDAVRRELQAIPGVRAALEAGRDRRAAVLVNRWLAPRVAAAYDADAVIDTLGSSAHELLSAFAVREGGVFCDGAADTLVAALRLLGISATRLDFGHTADGLTHTTVVVAARGRHWLVDPTFALDLHGADGEPLDLVAAWQATADGVLDAVVVRTGTLAKRPMVGGPDDDARCGDRPGRWTMCALGTYLRAFAPALRRAGFPTGRHGLLMLSLRSPLIAPDFYGVAPRLVARRASVRHEPRPVRIVSVKARDGQVVVTVRNVRAYPAPAVVAVRTGAASRARATIVPAGERVRVTFDLAARYGTPAARVTIAHRVPAS